MINAIRKLLAHPDTRGLSIDDPQTTHLRRAIIQGNRFLVAHLRQMVSLDIRMHPGRPRRRG